MIDLIERIEAATEPSKEINRIIAKLMGWHRIEPRFINNSRGGWIAPEDFIGVKSDGSPIFDSMHGTYIHDEVPPYTSSIDAAMTLVPEGNVILEIGVGGSIAEIQGWRSRAHGKTPALALCAAALKVHKP